MTTFGERNYQEPVLSNSARLASIAVADLGGDAWLVDRTTGTVYIDAACPAADVPYYVYQALTASEARRPHLRVVR